MRQYREQVVKNNEIEKVFCNKCGKEIKVENGMLKEDVLEVQKRWSYFSGRDNEVHSFDLCEDCYGQLIADFKIPVENEV